MDFIAGHDKVTYNIGSPRSNLGGKRMIELAQFPLQLVVFPKESIHLHIFEDRYKQLVHECLKNDSTFGVTPYIDKQLAEYGTEVSIKEISKTHSNGSMDIKCLGHQIYRIQEFHSIPADEGYSKAQITYLHSNEEARESTRANLLIELKKLMTQLGDRYQLNVNLNDLHTSQFIHKLGLDLKIELELLSMLDEEARQIRLTSIVGSMAQKMTRANEIKRRIQLNGHFKRLDPLDF